MNTTARLHDGEILEIEVRGVGPNLLMPVNPTPIEGPQAEAMRQWGADPALGRSLIDGLADVARVVAFDYEGHVLATPKPDTLTPANVVADFLAVADAVGVDRFAYYGYSWLAMVGLQLALATERVTGLAMGGYPPIDGPYAEMLQVTTIGYELATGARTSGGEDEWASATLQPDQQRQFVTLYEALAGFDERAALRRMRRDVERLCFVGSNDEIRYGPTWGDVFVSIAGPVVRGRAELEALGWEVHVLDGLDHIAAMQAANVLPILRPWISRIAGSETRVVSFPTDQTALTHILVVSDTARSRAWYTDVLGASIYREYGDSVVLSFAGAWLLLVTGGDPTADKPSVTLAPPSDPDRPDNLFTIRVDDCHATYDLLRARGASFLTPPVTSGAETRCFFRDPDGHLFEISEYRA